MTVEERNEMNRKFNDYVVANMRSEREAVERRWDWLKGREAVPDTHDEWRELNK